MSNATTAQEHNMDLTITLSRDAAVSLCDQAMILYHDDNEMPGVPNGTFYDTNNGRWTWSLDEAARWAIAIIAENAR